MPRSSYGESFFDGPGAQAAKGPLIGGGLTQVGRILVKKFLPSQAKWASLIGMVLGGGVSAFLMTKPQHKETGAAGLATALIIGVPELINNMVGGTLMGADDLSGLDAYTSEMGEGEELGANALELLGETPGGIEIQDSGGGSTGVIGAYTSEMGATVPENIQIQGYGSNAGRF